MFLEVLVLVRIITLRVTEKFQSQSEMLITNFSGKQNTNLLFVKNGMLYHVHDPLCFTICSKHHFQALISVEHKTFEIVVVIFPNKSLVVTEVLSLHERKGCWHTLHVRIAVVMPNELICSSAVGLENSRNLLPCEKW